MPSWCATARRSSMPASRRHIRPTDRTPPSAARDPSGKNGRMHLDHVSFAAGPSGLAATTDELGKALGATFIDGGAHPRFGTRNMVLPLKNHQYVEVVEVLDHP